MIVSVAGANSQNLKVVATVEEGPGLNARQHHSYLQSVKLLHIVTPHSDSTYTTGKSTSTEGRRSIRWKQVVQTQHCTCTKAGSAGNQLTS